MAAEIGATAFSAGSARDQAGVDLVPGFFQQRGGVRTKAIPPDLVSSWPPATCRLDGVGETGELFALHRDRQITRTGLRLSLTLVERRRHPGMQLRANVVQTIRQ